MFFAMNVLQFLSNETSSAFIGHHLYTLMVYIINKSFCRKFLVFATLLIISHFTRSHGRSVEEHRSLGGSINSRLDNGAFLA